MTTIIQLLAALPALIQALMELMSLAEEAWPDTGTGQTKKEKVMEAIKAMMEIGDVLWDKVQAFISAVINFLAVMKFKSKLP